MATLLCDICGGKLVIDAGGVAVCEKCGMEHSNDRVKEKLMENISNDETSVSADIESLLKRGQLFLEDSEWEKADECFEKILDSYLECAPAYIGKLCVELEVNKDTLLAECNYISQNRNYQKAVRFAADEYRRKIEGVNDAILSRLDESQRVLSPKREYIKKYTACISSGWYHVVGLKHDGTVVAAGENEYGQCNVQHWDNIVAVSAGLSHTVGLKANGIVIAVGDNESGQCNTTDWHDIRMIAAGAEHTVGLRADGSVEAVGRNDDGECDTRSWHDIVEIAAGDGHTVGLRVNGTVAATGNNERCQCDTDEWRDIVSISAGSSLTVGLKENGTIVAAGVNASFIRNIAQYSRDIISVSVGNGAIFGLMANGAVVGIKETDDGKSFKRVSTMNGENIAPEWQNVVAVTAGADTTPCLKSDGTVIARGKHGEFEGWQDIRPVSEEFALILKREEQRRFEDASFYMRVKMVFRHSQETRAVGRIIKGQVTIHDKVTILGANQTALVSDILFVNKPLRVATAGLLYVALVFKDLRDMRVEISDILAIIPSEQQNQQTAEPQHHIEDDRSQRDQTVTVGAENTRKANRYFNISIVSGIVSILSVFSLLIPLMLVASTLAIVFAVKGKNITMKVTTKCACGIILGSLGVIFYVMMLLMQVI